MELRGSNAGTAPWDWTQAATKIVPPSTNFATTVDGSLAYVEADAVKIDGIEFDGVNNSLNDATPRIIHGENSRASLGIVAADGYSDLRFLNNHFKNLTSTGVSVGSSAIQNNILDVKNNAFDNITGVGSAIANAIAIINHVPQVTGNRVTRSNAGVMLQYNGSPNTSGVATIASNQILAYVRGIAVWGVNEVLVPALLIQDNTIERIDYSFWSADGVTPPTNIEFTGMSLSKLLGDNDILVEGNTISKARSAVYLVNIVKSAVNPDRLLLKNNTHINSQSGVFIDNATEGATRTIVESSVIRDTKRTGLEVRGDGAYENKLVLKNGVVIEHPTPFTDTDIYNDAIYLSGAKAMLAELGDTRISSVIYNFITFHNNAMAGKEVDGSNVTYDGTVNGFTFDNYKPSEIEDVTLKAAVKDRIVDGEDETYAGSGIVRIATATGLQGLEKYAAVQVYPNPTNTGFINISLNGVVAKNVRVALYNIKGQIVLEQIEVVKLSGAQFQLNVGKLPKGLYLLKLSDGNEVSTRKVVLE